MSRKRSSSAACLVEDSSSADTLIQRDSVIAQYQSFVEGIVGRLMRTMNLPQVLREDFVAAGYLGLVEAAGRFDPNRGHEFRSYAFLRIRGAIIDHIRSSCDLSGRAYRMFRALEVSQELRSTEAEALKPKPQNPRSRAAEALEHLSKSAVAFVLVRGSEEALAVEDDGQGDPERALAAKQVSQKIRDAIATLPEKERTIIEQYYFKDRKLVEVAEQYSGLSKSWVSRLHDRALAMLRDALLEDGEEAVL